jgi:hypothetical protein
MHWPSLIVVLGRATGFRFINNTSQIVYVQTPTSTLHDPVAVGTDSNAYRNTGTYKILDADSIHANLFYAVVFANDTITIAPGTQWGGSFLLTTFLI